MERIFDKDTALVLEGGGMRGLYTCGVLDYFLDHGIEFPAVYAVSAGSCHAMSYLSKQRGRAYRLSTEFLEDWRYCSVRSLLLTGDMFGARFCYETIPDKLIPYDYKTFAENPTELYAVCTNLETGKAEYIPVKDGKRDIVYVRASSSLPLVSRTVRTPHGKLLDGGMCDSIPIRHALEHHKRCVVVLTQPEGFVKKPSSSIKAIRLRYRKYPSFIDAASRRHIDYNESLAAVDAAVKDGRALVIRPSESAGFARIEKDKEKLVRLYERGLSDAEKCGIEAFLQNCSTNM